MTSPSFRHASNIMKNDNEMKHMNNKQSMCFKLNWNDERWDSPFSLNDL